MSLSDKFRKFRERKPGKVEKTINIILAVMLFSLIAFFIQPRYKFAFQTDYSVNFRLGLIDKYSLDPKKGDYVAFKFLSVKDDPRYGRMFVKKVACIPGEIMENRGRDFYCNGEHLGYAKLYSKKGDFLTVFEHNGPVPEGSIFTVGEVQDSYDSKFWGFVKKEWIIGSVKRII